MALFGVKCMPSPGDEGELRSGVPFLSLTGEPRSIMISLTLDMWQALRPRTTLGYKELSTTEQIFSTGMIKYVVPV